MALIRDTVDEALIRNIVDEALIVDIVVALVDNLSPPLAPPVVSPPSVSLPVLTSVQY